MREIATKFLDFGISWKAENQQGKSMEAERLGRERSN